jgi:hypothetical protein
MPSVSRLAAGATVVLLLAAPAAATMTGPVGPTSRLVTGPYGVVLRAPALRTPCAASGEMRVRASAHWSRLALKRPVREIRVLLQRPGSEGVIDSVAFAPARVTTTRRALLRSATCRPNLDVRYELFVGRRDVPHDHQSIVFRTHGRAADMAGRRGLARNDDMLDVSRHSPAPQSKPVRPRAGF